jgi:thiol-disulfide isomerase/thioredoxin
MKKIIHITFLFVFVLIVIPTKAQNKVMMEYWEDVDFNDTSLVSSKTMSDKLINYFYSFTDGDEQHFDSLSIAGLGVVLDKAKVNMRMYEYILEFALNGYSAMGRDRVTNYLLNYPQLAEGEITMEEGLRLDSITEPYQKVRVGAKAPDYFGITIDEKIYAIFASRAKYILVVFWSTDCEYCHDFLVQIRKNMDLKSDFELVTFALADDEEEVKKAVKKMRLPGYHFYEELRWDSEAFLDYHITSTPTVYVLDENKNIVCKPYDWQELKYWLKSNNITY